MLLNWMILRQNHWKEEVKQDEVTDCKREISNRDDIEF